VESEEAFGTFITAIAPAPGYNAVYAARQDNGTVTVYRRPLTFWAVLEQPDSSAVRGFVAVGPSIIPADEAGILLGYTPDPFDAEDWLPTAERVLAAIDVLSREVENAESEEAEVKAAPNVVDFTKSRRTGR
jgi:hypothetical protein